MEGFGTVVTGTLLEGCCQVGQEVELYPTEKTVKIREIQTHGHKVDMAYAGQRTASTWLISRRTRLTGEMFWLPRTPFKSQFIDAKCSYFLHGQGTGETGQGPYQLWFSPGHMQGSSP